MITFEFSHLERSRSLRFQSLVSRKGAELGHVTPTKNHIRGSATTPSHSTLSDFEKSKSRSFTFRSLMFCKRAELGHMLLLNIDMKSYAGSPLMRLHLTLVTLKDQSQGHSDFEGLYLIKELS